MSLKNNFLCIFLFVAALSMVSLSSCHLAPTEPNALTTGAQIEVTPLIERLPQPPLDLTQVYESLPQREADWLATAVVLPTPSGDEITRAWLTVQAPRTADATRRPTPTLEFGLFTSGKYFEVHPPRHMDVENVWQGFAEEQLMRIYAGLLKPSSPRLEPDQTQYGAIYLLIAGPYGSYADRALYQTEEEIGAIEIVEVIDQFVVLKRAADDAPTPDLFYFDLLERRFLETIDPS